MRSDVKQTKPRPHIYFNSRKARFVWCMPNGMAEEWTAFGCIRLHAS